MFAIGPTSLDPSSFVLKCGYVLFVNVASWDSSSATKHANSTDKTSAATPRFRMVDMSWLSWALSVRLLQRMDHAMRSSPTVHWHARASLRRPARPVRGVKRDDARRLHQRNERHLVVEELIGFGNQR